MGFTVIARGEPSAPAAALVALGAPVGTLTEPADAPRTVTVKVQEPLALIRPPMSLTETPPVEPNRDALVQVVVKSDPEF
jgi:hypothetical protein